LVNHFFLIKKIQIVSSDNNIKILGLDYFENKNILLFNSEKAGQELIGKNPLIKSVLIFKKLPDSLVIKAEKDTPIVIIKADNGFFLLSQSGKIIIKTKENNSGLPIINYYQNLYYYQYQPGEIIDYQDILVCLSFLKKVEDLGLKVDTIDIAGVYMVAFNLDKKKIIFSLEKNRTIQAYQLETLIKQFQIEGKEFVSLDLRFDKPIIKIN